MDHRPFFSVIIPLYNKENYVRDAIDSISAQTFRSFEIVVVDDGSTDDSAKIVRAIDYTRILISPQENAGVSAARNKGLQIANGAYVAFLDADDLWHPDLLAAAHRAISANPEIAFWSCGVGFLRHGEIRSARYSTRTDHLPGFVENYFDASLADPIVTASSVVIKKSLALETKGFPVGESHGEDLVMWARIARRTRLFFDPEIHAYYRLGESNNLSVSTVPKSERLMVLNELEESFEKGDFSGLRYYALYCKKSAVQQALAGRGRPAFRILNHGLATALVYRRFRIVPAMLQNYIRLIILTTLFALLRLNQHPSLKC